MCPRKAEENDRFLAIYVLNDVKHHFNEAGCPSVFMQLNAVDLGEFFRVDLFKFRFSTHIDWNRIGTLGDKYFLTPRVFLKVD